MPAIKRIGLKFLIKYFEQLGRENFGENVSQKLN